MGCLDRCKNGMIYKIHKIYKSMYVFRCSCPLGMSSSYPVWSSLMAVDFMDEPEPPVSAPKKNNDPDEGLCPF